MSRHNYGQMLAGAPHIRGSVSVRGMMLQVLLAMLPGLLVWLLLFGTPGLLLLLVTVAAALAAEALCLRCRGLGLGALSDCSAAVTAVLLALCLSPQASFMVAALAAIFAIVVGKHAFGGIGRNLFNPAMLGFAFAIICFPQELSQWFPVVPGDAVSAATPLVTIADGLVQMRMIDEVLPGMAADSRTSLYLWLALAWLAGGMYLVLRKIIDWRVPGCMLLGMFVLAGVFWMYDEQRYLAPWWHCVLGGTMLGAFFVITDPVSSPVVLRARMVFACGVGVLTWWIRHFGALADGVAFAVLIMNALAPVLDKLLGPKVMGTEGER